jgi:hypothetical protein
MHPDSWGHDDVTKHISDHIKRMPDVPAIAIALIVQDRTKDAEIIRACAKFKETYVAFTALENFGFSFGVCILALEPDTQVNPCAFLELLSSLPYDEAAVYVRGEARIRLAPVVRP